MQQVGESAPVGLHARAARRRCAVDGAVLGEDAGEVHLRQHLDDAGAADAGDAELPGLLREAFLVRPEIAADYFERSEEHTSELQSLMRISYAVFCLKKKNTQSIQQQTNTKE